MYQESESEVPAAEPPGRPSFLDGFLPEDEYAALRGVTQRTCQRDRQRRQGPPYVRFGRRIFYRIEAVREWLIKNERDETLSVIPRRHLGGNVKRRMISAGGQS